MLLLWASPSLTNICLRLMLNTYICMSNYRVPLYEIFTVPVFTVPSRYRIPFKYSVSFGNIVTRCFMHNDSIFHSHCSHFFQYKPLFILPGTGMSIEVCMKDKDEVRTLRVHLSVTWIPISAMYSCLISI